MSERDEWDEKAAELMSGWVSSEGYAEFSEKELASELRAAAESALRSAAAKRFPGTEPPDTDRDVIAYWRSGDVGAAWFEDGRWHIRGAIRVSTPESWTELPPLEGEGGKA